MSYRGAKVLVTGADGFIGSHLTGMLVEQGASVTALALYYSFDQHGWIDDLPEPVRRGCEVVRGDIRDAAFVRPLVQGQDVVFVSHSRPPQRHHPRPYPLSSPSLPSHP